MKPRPCGKTQRAWVFWKCAEQHGELVALRVPPLVLGVIYKPKKGKAHGAGRRLADFMPEVVSVPQATVPSWGGPPIPYNRGRASWS